MFELMCDGATEATSVEPPCERGEGSLDRFKASSDGPRACDGGAALEAAGPGLGELLGGGDGN